MAYELYEVGEDGKEELMLEMTKEKPERFVYGDEDNMLPAICQAIGGKTAGEGFDFTVTPENGFGEYQDGLVKKLSRKMFEMDGEFDSKHVYVGAAITMMTAEGRPAPGMVLDITDEDVTVDFNHPMAGMTMHFKGEIVTVRDATEAELHPQCGELAQEKQNGPAKLMLKMMLKAAKGDPNFRLTDDILPDRITWFANELCSEPESEHAPEIM